MKNFSHCNIVLLLCTLVSGCELLCQAGTGTCGLSREQAERLLHPKPFIEYWDKPGMTVEGRRQNWMECGGLSDGSFSPSERILEAEKTRLGVTMSIAHFRLESDFQRCIISKGYHYTGACTEGISMSALPACGVQ